MLIYWYLPTSNIILSICFSSYKDSIKKQQKIRNGPDEIELLNILTSGNILVF